MLINNKSTILIVNDIDETLIQLKATLPLHNTRVIRNEEKDEIQLVQAQLVIKEAYISSNETKYIIICGNSFRTEAQNSLLKVFEEPPQNIVFVIIATSKSSILGTILSRVPHKYLKKSTQRVDIEFDLNHLDLKTIYLFLKENQRISKNEAKSIVESILFKINKQKIELTQKELELFSNSMKLLELNSRPIQILTTLLLTISQRKTR